MALQPSRGIFRSFDLLVKRFHFSVNAYSAFQKQKPINLVLINPITSKRQWPNPSLGPLDSVNPLYPLPGSVGIIPASTEKRCATKEQLTHATQTLPPIREEHYASVLVDTYNATEMDSTRNPLIPPSSSDLECTIHACPTLIQRDLSAIFNSKNFGSTPLTAIVLSHRTDDRYDEWSEEAAIEREYLADSFTKSAIDICASLNELGYWADFINPFTGKPYLGAHGEGKLVETDENMKHFGFEIDEMMCCKVLRHPRWKNHVFAGLIFTDAPRDHPVLSHL